MSEELKFLFEIETLINFIISAILGVITGVGASILIIKCYVPRLRPNIDISPYICRFRGQDGKETYVFKFVNNSDVEIFDVVIEPSFFSEFNTIDGKHRRRRKIYLKTNKITFVPKKDILDQYNSHAIVVKTTEDLKKNWKNDSTSLNLTIMARHSVSGFNKVFHHTFLSSDCIVDGVFSSGDSLDYKPKIFV